MNVPLPITLANCTLQTPAQIQPWFHWAQPDATLVAAILATCGWVYTARKARTSARKQHTINALMTAEFNDSFREAEEYILPYLKAGGPVNMASINKNEKDSFKFVLNRYEFLAAGIRNGDFDEQLVSDSLKSATVVLFNVCEKWIDSLRSGRSRMAMYEHLEWLHDRWSDKKPGVLQRSVEWVRGRPFQGKRA